MHLARWRIQKSICHFILVISVSSQPKIKIIAKKQRNCNYKIEKLCTKIHLFKNTVRKLNNFVQLLIELGISYISATKSPQHQSVDKNLGFTKRRIFLYHWNGHIQLCISANKVISREIQLRRTNDFK